MLNFCLIQVHPGYVVMLFFHQHCKVTLSQKRRLVVGFFFITKSYNIQK